MPKKANPNQRRLGDLQRLPVSARQNQLRKKLVNMGMMPTMVLKGLGAISILPDFQLIR